MCYFCTYTHHKSINLAAVALWKCVCQRIDRYGTISCICILPTHGLITKPRESQVFSAEVKHFRWLYLQWPTRVRRRCVCRVSLLAAGPIWRIFYARGNFMCEREQGILTFNLYWLDFRLKCDHVSKIRFVINDPVALHLFAWFTVKICIQFRIESNWYGTQYAIKIEIFHASNYIVQIRWKKTRNQYQLWKKLYTTIQLQTYFEYVKNSWIVGIVSSLLNSVNVTAFGPTLMSLLVQLQFLTWKMKRIEKLEQIIIWEKF